MKGVGRGKENPAEGKDESMTRVLRPNSLNVLQDVTVLTPDEKLGWGTTVNPKTIKHLLALPCTQHKYDNDSRKQQDSTIQKSLDN